MVYGVVWMLFYIQIKFYDPSLIVSGKKKILSEFIFSSIPLYLKKMTLGYRFKYCNTKNASNSMK